MLDENGHKNTIFITLLGVEKDLQSFVFFCILCILFLFYSLYNIILWDRLVNEEKD